MHYFSDRVSIRFFCIMRNEWVRFWAPGNSGPEPSTLPLPPKTWTINNVMNNVDLLSDSYYDQVCEGHEFNGPYDSETDDD